MIASALVFLSGAAVAIQMPESQRQAMEQYRQSFSTCVDLLSCEAFLIRPSLRVWLSDEQKAHITEVFRNGGSSSRAMLIHSLEGRGYSETRLPVTIGVEIGGFSNDQIIRLLELARDDEFSGAFILLGANASEEIIEQLIEMSDPERRTSAFRDAIELAGEHAINPIYMSVLEHLRAGDDQQARRLASYLRYRGRSTGRASGDRVPISEPVVRELTDKATNSNLDYPSRLAAMYILSNLGSDIEPVEDRLVSLARRGEPGIADVAMNILMQVGNNDFVLELLARCDEFALDGDKYFEIIGDCPLGYFASLGRGAIEAGPRLLELSYSEHLGFRKVVFRTLAAIHYQPAIPRLRERLNSEYWTETLAVSEALRDMDIVEARRDIESISRSHWFPFVREELEILLARWDGLTLEDIGVDGWRFPQADECPSRRWRWDNSEISHGINDAEEVEPPADDFGRRLALQVPGGELSGTDRGEWGGELVGSTATNPSVRLFDDNILGMVRYEDGALVATGLSHLTLSEGNILRVWADGDSWHVIHLTETPGPAYGGLSRIGGTTYAAFGSRIDGDYGRRQFVTVFDADLGVLGLAECIHGTSG